MSSIGVFDSGIGGWSVIRHLLSYLPGTYFLYLKDPKNLPLGAKSKEEIIRITRENGEILLKYKIEMLILACHTASIHFDPTHFPIPVIGMIEPTLKAIEKAPKKPLALLGTLSTIQSGVYQKKIRERFPMLDVESIACPDLASQIEKNPRDDKTLTSLVRKYLAPVMRKKIETICLACTHYPLIIPIFKKVLGGNIHIIDPGEEVAKEASLLTQWQQQHFSSQPSR